MTPGDDPVVYHREIKEWQGSNDNVMTGAWMQELGHNLFGAIEPASDRDNDPNHGAPYHDRYDDRAMWW